MAFRGGFNALAFQPISETSTVKRHPLGTTVRAYDVENDTEAEFIYLKGVASTLAGDLVVYDGGDTTRAVAASKGPAAVSMSANVANQFGWYARLGRVKTNIAGGVVDGALVYTSGTTGAVDDTVVANQNVGGSKFAETAASGQAFVELAYPVIGEF